MNKLRVVYAIDFINPQFVTVRDVSEAFTVAAAIKGAIDLMYQKAKLTHKTTIINLERYNEETDGWEFWFDDKGNDITAYVNLSNR